MFRASTDGGKTFGDKINLSNPNEDDSVNVNIAAQDAKVRIPSSRCNLYIIHA
jgi:hypothetical protein